MRAAAEAFENAVKLSPDRERDWVTLGQIRVHELGDNVGAQEALLGALRQASGKGLATALYLYGMVQERGLGVAQDRSAAAVCYKQAAEKGLKEAFNKN